MVNLRDPARQFGTDPVTIIVTKRFPCFEHDAFQFELAEYLLAEPRQELRLARNEGTRNGGRDLKDSLATAQELLHLERDNAAFLVLDVVDVHRLLFWAKTYLTHQIVIGCANAFRQVGEGVEAASTIGGWNVVFCGVESD